MVAKAPAHSMEQATKILPFFPFISLAISPKLFIRPGSATSTTRLEHRHGMSIILPLLGWANRYAYSMEVFPMSRIHMEFAFTI